jgi:hypothetical protein
MAGAAHNASRPPFDEKETARFLLKLCLTLDAAPYECLSRELGALLGKESHPVVDACTRFNPFKLLPLSKTVPSEQVFPFLERVDEALKSDNHSLRGDVLLGMLLGHSDLLATLKTLELLVIDNKRLETWVLCLEATQPPLERNWYDWVVENENTLYLAAKNQSVAAFTVKVRFACQRKSPSTEVVLRMIQREDTTLEHAENLLALAPTAAGDPRVAAALKEKSAPLTKRART